MRAFALLFFASVLLVRADGKPTGRWEGSVEIPGRELHLIVDLAEEGQSWRGSIICRDLNVAGAALTGIEQKGSEITFAFKPAVANPAGAEMKFAGHFDTDERMTGECVEAGNRAPFALAKTGPPQMDKPRRSTAIAEEIAGQWKGGYELFGYPREVTLTLKNRGAEGATADLLIVGKKENRIPVDLVMQEGSYLAIDSQEAGLSFEGRASKDELKGVILQGPLEIPVTLRRTK